MNVKPIGAFKSGLIRQVVFERRGLKSRDHCTNLTKKNLTLELFFSG